MSNNSVYKIKFREGIHEHEYHLDTDIFKNAKTMATIQMKKDGYKPYDVIGVNAWKELISGTYWRSFIQDNDKLSSERKIRFVKLFKRVIEEN